jgi:hypothetical protein
VTSGRGEAEVSFTIRCHEELLDRVLSHGPPWGRCHAVSGAHESGAFVAPAGRDAQAAKLVGYELEVPEVSGLVEGESTAHQILYVDDDDCICEP